MAIPWNDSADLYRAVSALLPAGEGQNAMLYDAFVARIEASEKDLQARWAHPLSHPSKCSRIARLVRCQITVSRAERRLAGLLESSSAHVFLFADIFMAEAPFAAFSATRKQDIAPTSRKLRIEYAGAIWCCGCVNSEDTRPNGRRLHRVLPRISPRTLCSPEQLTDRY